MYSCLGLVLGCHREFFSLLGRKSRELLLNDIPTIKMLVLAHINYIVCKLFWTISKPESQRYKCESNFGTTTIPIETKV